MYVRIEDEGQRECGKMEIKIKKTWDICGRSRRTWNLVIEIIKRKQGRIESYRECGTV